MIERVIIKPPIIVLWDGTSLIPKIGNHTKKTPPKTSVNDNKVSSAAGKLLDPNVNNTNPEHTKKPCKVDSDEFLKLSTKSFSEKNKANKEMMKQNNPPNDTVVNFGVSFFHLNVTAKIAKPTDDISPHIIPKKSLKSVLLYVIKIIPMDAMIIEIQVVVETLSLRKMYARIAVINGITANIKSVFAAVVLVNDQIKPIAAKAIPKPPKHPDKPILV